MVEPTYKLHTKGGFPLNTESLRTNDSVPPSDTVDNKSEIEQVLERYSDMVYRLAFARTKNRYDADDILQEVFLRYIRRQPDCRDEEHRKAWLIRSTINCSKSLFSSAWFRNITPIPDTLSCEMKEHSEVYYAVMALPARYRTVIHLYYYEDYSTAEIATLLACKDSTIRSRLHRARTLLRKQIDADIL